MGRLLASLLVALLALPMLPSVALWRAAGGGDAAGPDAGAPPEPERPPDRSPAERPPTPGAARRRKPLPWARVVALCLLLLALVASVAAAVAATGRAVGSALGDASTVSPLAIAAAGLWCALIVWKVPQWQAAAWRGDRYVDPKEAFEVENGARGTIGQLVSGLAILAGLYFGWQQLGQTTQNLQVSEQGQITDRFSKAIEQLGSDELTVRLGGIYALERIARDSPRDYAATMEVLSAFARRAGAAGAASPVALNAPVVPSPLPQDLEAVMQVIGRRTPSQVAQEQADGIACLRLEGVRLDGISLAGANLTGLCLDGASLAGASLDGANLSGSSLVGIDLRGASLGGANLGSAQLTGANLTAANLSNADLHAATVVNAVLDQTTLLRTNLRDALLVRASMQGAQLFDADLRGADLLDTNLTGAVITASDLREAKHLTAAQLDAATIDRSNQLPDGIAATPDF